MSTDIDKLIAERVMGWGWRDFTFDGDNGNPTRFLAEPGDRYPFKSIPPHSTDPAAAWQVVERMSTTTKEYWTIDYFSTGCVAMFKYEGGRDLPWQPGEHVGEANTMPEAVCKAALAALGG